MLKRWDSLLHRLINADINVFEQNDLNLTFKIIESVYNSEKRYYHTFKHIEYMLINLDKHFTDLLTPKEKDIIELAIWFHYFIYDIENPPNENELHSADIVSNFSKLVKLDDDIRHQAFELILATIHNKKQTTFIGKIICDLDLLELSDFSAYFKNRHNVRKEYHNINDEQFLEGRKKFLELMLNKETIYQTELFQKHFEKSSRQHLSIELNYFY